MPQHQAARLVELVQDASHPEFSIQTLKGLTKAKDVKGLKKRHPALSLPAFSNGKDASNLLAAIKQSL